MQKPLIMLACIVLLGVVARPIAHHAFTAEFDRNMPVTIQGAVKQMDWINPHSWIYLDIKDPQSGKIEEWAVEAAAPNALVRRGFTKASLPAGTEIRVAGFRSKDGANRMSGAELTYVANGKSLFMGSSGVGAPSDPK